VTGAHLPFSERFIARPPLQVYCFTVILRPQAEESQPVIVASQDPSLRSG
jgi:hypothetical protein